MPAGLLLAGLLLCAVLGGCAEKPLPLEEQLDLGMRYLSELNYENAVIAFTAAIEIHSRNVQAYAGLYSAYAAQGETELAEQTWDAMLEAGVSVDRAYRWIERMADTISQAGGDGEAVLAASILTAAWRMRSRSMVNRTERP